MQILELNMIFYYIQLYGVHINDIFYLFVYFEKKITSNNVLFLRDNQKFKLFKRIPIVSVKF